MNAYFCSPGEGCQKTMVNVMKLYMEKNLIIVLKVNVVVLKVIVVFFIITVKQHRDVNLNWVNVIIIEK